MQNTNEQVKKMWVTLKVLRGHIEDVYEDKLINLLTTRQEFGMFTKAILSDHEGFVQGISWDPKYLSDK